MPAQDGQEVVLTEAEPSAECRGLRGPCVAFFFFEGEAGSLSQPHYFATIP